MNVSNKVTDTSIKNLTGTVRITIDTKKTIAMTVSIEAVMTITSEVEAMRGAKSTVAGITVRIMTERTVKSTSPPINLVLVETLSISLALLRDMLDQKNDDFEQLIKFI